MLLGFLFLSFLLQRYIFFNLFAKLIHIFLFLNTKIIDLWQAYLANPSLYIRPYNASYLRLITAIEKFSSTKWRAFSCSSARLITGRTSLKRRS